MLKNFRRNDQTCATLTLIVCVHFRTINFRRCHQLQKYFYNEKFLDLQYMEVHGVEIAYPPIILESVPAPTCVCEIATSLKEIHIQCKREALYLLHVGEKLLTGLSEA